MVGIRGEQKRCFLLPNFINVFKYYGWFTNGFSIMDQNWNFPVNWIHAHKQRTFIGQVLIPVVISNSFLFQRYSNPRPKGTRPVIQENYILHLGRKWSEGPRKGKQLLQKWDELKSTLLEQYICRLHRRFPWRMFVLLGMVFLYLSAKQWNQ